MVVLVHSQSGLLCGAALPGAFFSRKTAFFVKKHDFDDFLMIFLQNGRNLLLNRGTINERKLRPGTTGSQPTSLDCLEAMCMGYLG